MAKERSVTEKIKVTEALVAQARARTQAGEFEGMIHDWKDTADLAFVLRARGRSLSYLYRTRDKALKIADALEMNESYGRFGHALVGDALRRNEDHRNVLRIFHEEIRNHRDEAAVFQATALRTQPDWNAGKTPGWTVGELRDAYLAMTLPTMRRRSGSQVERFMLSDEIEKFAPIRAQTETAEAGENRLMLAGGHRIWSGSFVAIGQCTILMRCRSDARRKVATHDEPQPRDGREVSALRKTPPLHGAEVHRRERQGMVGTRLPLVRETLRDFGGESRM